MLLVISKKIYTSMAFVPLHFGGGGNRTLDEFYKIFIASDVCKSMMLVGWSASQSIKEMSSVILEEICFKTIHA